jgi:toluene monooxygenase system ferredoxin subunit
MSKTIVCKAADIPMNGMRRFDLPNGLKVLIANAEGELFAYQGICPHQDVCLGDGFFDGKTLTCHQHLWQWDIRNGSAIGLAEAPLEQYALEVQGEDVLIGEGSALHASELFVGLSPDILAKLDGLATRKDLKAGERIYKVGDRADDFYVLESGRVEFLIGRDDRTTNAGFMLKKGELFGWAALLGEAPTRIASAVAHDDSAVLCLNGAATLKVLETDPASAYHAMRRLSALITRYLSSEGAK